MFSYYGSKSKIVDYYPPPKYGKIIEPFAGSARYSLKYWDREIMLFDKYVVIIKVWKWLQQCSKQDILNLPDIYKLKKGFDLRTLNLSEGELLFMGLNAGIASTSPRYKISPMTADQNGMQTYFNEPQIIYIKLNTGKLNYVHLIKSKTKKQYGLLTLLISLVVMPI